MLDLLKQVRRYKAEQGLSVGAELERLALSVRPDLKDMLEASLVDLKSATRARELIFVLWETEAGLSLTWKANEVL